MTGPRITVEMLRGMNACAEQVERFRALWPDGVEVTEEALREAHAAALDVWWVADNRSTPPDVLAALGRDEDAVVRRCVADNRSTPPATTDPNAS